MADAGHRSSRQGGVEVARFVAACAVVLIHFWPRRTGGPSGFLEPLVVGTCRFAVPFFFAASGHFLRGRLPDEASAGRFAWKWAKILLFWHAVHAVWFTGLHLARDPDPFHHLPMWVSRIPSPDILLEGVAWPLWYLHSLVLCALLAAWRPLRERPSILLWLGGALYLFAMTCGPWRSSMPSWWPYRPLGIQAREFLFTGLLPFAAGYVVRSRPSASTAAWIALAGLGLQTVEILRFPCTSWGELHEFYLGSVVAGVFLFWASLGWDPPRRLASLGAASLPMYVLQLIVFAVVRTAIQTGLRFAGMDPTAAGLVSIGLALPLYAALCLRLSRTRAWTRLHR